MQRVVRCASAKAWREAWGNAPLPLMGLGRFIVVADTDAEALAIARRAYPRWHASFTHLHRHAQPAERASAPAGVRRAAKVGQGVAGSPRTVLAFLREQHAATGSNYCVGQFAFGDLSLAETQRSIELFAREVMPALQARRRSPRFDLERIVPIIAENFGNAARRREAARTFGRDRWSSATDGCCGVAGGHARQRSRAGAGQLRIGKSVPNSWAFAATDVGVQRRHLQAGRHRSRDFELQGRRPDAGRPHRRRVSMLRSAPARGSASAPRACRRSASRRCTARRRNLAVSGAGRSRRSRPSPISRASASASPPAAR